MSKFFKERLCSCTVKLLDGEELMFETKVNCGINFVPQIVVRTVVASAP